MIHMRLSSNSLSNTGSQIGLLPIPGSVKTLKATLSHTCIHNMNNLEILTCLTVNHQVRGGTQNILGKQEGELSTTHAPLHHAAVPWDPSSSYFLQELLANSVTVIVCPVIGCISCSRLLLDQTPC